MEKFFKYPRLIVFLFRRYSSKIMVDRFGFVRKKKCETETPLKVKLWLKVKLENIKDKGFIVKQDHKNVQSQIWSQKNIHFKQYMTIPAGMIIQKKMHRFELRSDKILHYCYNLQNGKIVSRSCMSSLSHEEVRILEFPFLKI